MLLAAVLSFLGLSIISLLSGAPEAGEMASGAIVLWLLAFFLISFAIAIISNIAGIGGGIIFVPIMMAYTQVDSMVIRSTGMIVAMFSGLISSGLLMKKGLGHFKMSMVLTISQGIGALIGAKSAVMTATALGESGEGAIRVALGVILVIVAIYLLLSSNRSEWPNITNIDSITKWMKLEHSYYEESEKRIRTYRIRRMPLGFTLVFIIGLIGGFFGLGAGWALSPIQNLVMGVPLKAAAANSGIILGMVNCVAVWPYILVGGIIPLFVLPWLSGQVAGGYLGSLALVRVKVSVVRILLIGIMVFTSFSLITGGFIRLRWMESLSSEISIVIFTCIMVIDLLFIIRKSVKGKDRNERSNH